MKRLFLCAASTSLLLSACATGPEASTTPSASARQEFEFTTGSNIPRRSRMGGDNVTTMTPEEFERGRTGGGPGGATQ